MVNIAVRLNINIKLQADMIFSYKADMISL